MERVTGRLAARVGGGGSQQMGAAPGPRPALRPGPFSQSRRPAPQSRRPAPPRAGTAPRPGPRAALRAEYLLKCIGLRACPLALPPPVHSPIRILCRASRPRPQRPRPRVRRPIGGASAGAGAGPWAGGRDWARDAGAAYGPSQAGGADAASAGRCRGRREPGGW